MSKELASEKCEACNNLTPKIFSSEAMNLVKTLKEGWHIRTTGSNLYLHKRWKFKDYDQAERFVIMVGDIARDENHHPDVIFGWGYVKINLWTHAIQGLSRNDFILAAKIDELPVPR